MADDKNTDNTNLGDEKPPKNLPADTPSGIADAMATIEDAKEDEQPAPETDIDRDADSFEELPEGATIAGSSTSVEALITAAQTRPRPAPAFDDEHIGLGGTYMIGEDGVRRPVYEEYAIPDPKSKAKEPKLVKRFRRVA